MTQDQAQLNAVFIQEARERLGELESALLDWEQQPQDADVIAAIFRSVHTLKGSGAMFGFDAIADFAHSVEAVLDGARAGRVQADRGLIDLTLAARDHLQAMVDAAERGEQADLPGKVALQQAFARYLPASGNEAPAATEGDAAVDSQEAEAARRTYNVRFRPHSNLLQNGSDPLLLLEELRSLGEAEVTALTDTLPPLSAMEPEACYLGWDVMLTTTAGEEAIRDVFIFVEDRCDLTINRVDDDSATDYRLADNDDTRLGELLVQRGDVEQAAVDDAMRARQPLGEVLMARGAATSDQVNAALQEQKERRSSGARSQEAAAAETVRVPAARLDYLVNLVSEMVTVQARLAQSAHRLEDSELNAVSEAVEQLTAEFRESTLNLRMVPVGSLFERFRRVVRDLANELGKQVDVRIEGAETELDKTVIERLQDPLMHIVRNAVDHGMEAPQERSAAGKPSRGTLRLTAAHEGAHVLIRVQDDGAGMDPQRIRARAVERGLVSADADLSDAEALQLVFAPGFSTAEAVTDVSGRGVGMDVVKRNIESLRGSVELNSTPGSGTEMCIRLPLTLAIIDGLLVSSGGDRFVIPLAAIDECVELDAAALQRDHGDRMLHVRGELVPYLRLRDRFSIGGERPPVEHVVIVQVQGQRLGLAVDRIIGNHQTVIKSLGRLLQDVDDLSGATVLGDGHVALILDVNAVLSGVQASQLLN